MNYVFAPHYAPYGNIPYRYAIARPRVHGGFAVIVEDIIVTPNLDEVTITHTKFPKAPRKFNLAV